MPFVEEAKSALFALPEGDSEAFEALALETFRFQARRNPVYGEYLSHLRVKPERVRSLAEAPYLPIGFFKTRKVVSVERSAFPLTFESSGTTGQTPSRHFLADPDFYRAVARTAFERAYGPLEGWHVLALLPSYLERSGSSLVEMVRFFVGKAASPSGFYLRNTGELRETLRALPQSGKRILLIGVTFALLDMAEEAPLALPPGSVVMETGGMKGRRQEMTREAVHERLSAGFGVPSVHSEYGMTELLSQAYSRGEGLFQAPPWVRASVRETTDPFAEGGRRASGVLKVADLANVESCAFVETQDLGRMAESGVFSVLGRMDAAEIRGCNLMVA